MNSPKRRFYIKLLSMVVIAAFVGTFFDGITNPGYSATGVTTLGTRSLISQPEQVITSNAGATWSDYNPPEIYPNTVEQKLQYITMRDGIKLAVYVTLPADDNGNAIPGQLPAILIQTSYNDSVKNNADPYMVKHGYVTVVVDVRGTGQSEGA
jgi:uncharacterized protein